MSRSKRRTPPEFGLYMVACPYCGGAWEVEILQFTGGEQSRGLLHCPKCSQKNEWHEGEFSFTIYRLIGKQSKSLRRGGPKLFNLRVMGHEGEREITFKTNSIPSLRSGDILTLSYPRTSKGIFSKKWTGEYSKSPNVLWNNTTNHGWML